MDSTSHHCGEFVIVTEHSKSNNSREQNKDRAQHINDKGDTQEKKLKDKEKQYKSIQEDSKAEKAKPANLETEKEDK